jgi:hypothetical protein
VTAVNPEKFAAGVAQIVRDYVDKRVAEVRAEVDSVREAQRSFRYRGTYRTGIVYVDGDFVTDRGHLWCAKASTDTRPPGEQWQLALRKEDQR